jgi:hypothetical protein
MQLRVLELAPIYARADSEMRARIESARAGDAEFRTAADEAWRGLEQLDAITAYQPSPDAAVKES